MAMKFDFGGWATRNNLVCSDGRTIMKDAFKDNDGQTVPLIWGHQHDDPDRVLGHALLENREEGVYAYCTLNETDAGKTAKLLIEHGDVNALSIYANKLKQHGANVLHGAIKEVSLVLAGANPGAFIDVVMQHGEECADEARIYTGMTLELCHADKDEKEEEKPAVNVEEDESEETLEEIFDTCTDKQKKAVFAMLGEMAKNQVVPETKNNEDEENSEGGNETMKHNVFDNESTQQQNVLSHADQQQIIALAKTSSVGSLRDAMAIYAENHKDTLAHGFEDISDFFPDYKNVVGAGAPELVTRDQGWIDRVLQKVHKSPISRIRTRQTDVRSASLRALGYEKGTEKDEMEVAALIKRTTDPQTVYIKDKLDRDDIVDIVDFDVVQYEYAIMRMLLNEEVARAIMIGDGRSIGADGKITEDHIRPIWTDNELYTIHADVDIDKATSELQGSDTAANFGENYIYAEAIISAALYAREQYKGSGSLDFYCTPHLLNVMLLARDMNGRRIYNSKADLAAALNVNEIHTVEQFEGQVRTTSDAKNKKLLGLFVNLADYYMGSTKGGEITRFNQFDIDFNQEKFLIETRLSGALARVKSAIALEEDVTGKN